MIAVQIEAPIVNHRIDFSSERRPSNIAQAKIIVMFEEPATKVSMPDIVALAWAARASFPKGDSSQRRAEFEATRSEWTGRGYDQWQCPA